MNRLASDWATPQPLVTMNGYFVPIVDNSFSNGPSQCGDRDQGPGDGGIPRIFCLYFPAIISSTTGQDTFPSVLTISKEQHIIS
jgi:hypothetical protein